MNMQRSFILVFVVWVSTSVGFAQWDVCGLATPIACGSVNTGTTANSLWTPDVAPFCGTGDGTGSGVWYRITGTGNTIVASLCGSAYDTRIRVYQGSCAALTCVTGNDDFCGLQSQVTWAAANAVNYYILVHGMGSAQGNYTLTITCPPPGGAMCYEINPIPYGADPYAGTLVTLTDDVHSGVVPIGFSFCFGGSAYNQCVISSNNYITFDLTRANTYSPWVTVAVPTNTPAEVRNAILGPWQDINPGIPGGQIRYQTLGTAPNRRFVVSYLNVPMFSCTSQLYTSQTILYEGSNCIGNFILTKPICASWNNGNAVHALHNSLGASATIVAGRNNTQWTATSQGRLFTPTCAPCQTPASFDCLPIILPIDLLDFSGERIGPFNHLTWSTANERNSERFIVERSADGELFHPVLHVMAAGNSQSTIDYQATDDAPLSGRNYYRLRSVDVDGSFTLSRVIAVDGVRKEMIAVLPNPASGSARLRLPEGTILPAAVLLLDITGRPIRTITAVGLDNPFDLTGLAKGTYFLEVPALGPGATGRFLVE